VPIPDRAAKALQPKCQGSNVLRKEATDETIEQHLRKLNPSAPRPRLCTTCVNERLFTLSIGR
jgi:hypothetical protein